MTTDRHNARPCETESEPAQPGIASFVNPGQIGMAQKGDIIAPQEPFVLPLA